MDAAGSLTLGDGYAGSALSIVSAFLARISVDSSTSRDLFEASLKGGKHMRLRTVILAGALASAPVFAAAQSPWVLRIDGHVVRAQPALRVVHTADGVQHIRTWTWRDPHGDARVVVQTTRGGPPPAWALQQLRAMSTQFAVMQAQMRQLEQAAWAGVPMLPQALPALSPQPWTPAAPQRVIVVVPQLAPHHAVPGIRT
jgi:hypothetical protein